MRLVQAADGAQLRIVGLHARMGGEAAVYGALGPDGPCVIKVAHRSSPLGDWLIGERTLLERLGADPRTAGLVPRVRHHGSWDGRPFVALERFDRSVLEVLDDVPPMAERLSLARRVAARVEQLHRARPDLVHRDLKPANLLLDASRLVISDFGIAREQGPEMASTTRAHLTAGYAAPEQSLPHRRADPSWDVFGLAATVFHIVTGHPPVAPAQATWTLTPLGRRLRSGGDAGRGESWDYLDFARCSALSVEDRTRLDAAVSGPLRAVLERAMHPDPRRRSGSAAAILQALERTHPAGSAPERSLSRWTVAALPILVGLGAAAVWWERPEPIAYPLVRIEAGYAPDPSADAIPVAAFELGLTEVTQAQWTALMGSPVSERRVTGAGGPAEGCVAYEGVGLVGPERPMICVDYLDAVHFANSLSEQHGLPPVYRLTTDPDRGAVDVAAVPGSTGFRLPTVAEWRRAVTPDSGAALDPCAENIADTAWLDRFPGSPAESCTDGVVGTSDVGHFPAGPHGIFDGHGNVAEWADDPDGPERRWVTSGQFAAIPEPFGLAVPTRADSRQISLGFRLARSLP